MGIIVINESAWKLVLKQLKDKIICSFNNIAHKFFLGIQSSKKSTHINIYE